MLVLTLALLLSAPMNLFCIAVDTDNDDETPPITLELSVVAAYHELSNESAMQCSIAGVKNPAVVLLPAFNGTIDSELKAAAIPFNVPLRC